jgi:hypothetical protein
LTQIIDMSLFHLSSSGNSLHSDVVMPLEALRTIVYKHNYTVVSLINKHPSHLSSQEIQSMTQLSHKQLYTALERLKKVDVIKSHKKEYTLTVIAKEILQSIVSQIRYLSLTISFAAKLLYFISSPFYLLILLFHI